MPADPLAPLLAAVFTPTAARPSGRLRPVVVGRGRGPSCGCAAAAGWG